MTLGEKLQKVYQKVYTKLGQQDGTITIRKKSVTPATEFGREYVSSTSTSLSLADGVRVDRVKAYEVAQVGDFRLDDLKLFIPGNLVTETQLDQAQIVYGGKTYSVKSKSPTEILGGVVVQWRVIARLEV